MQSSSEHPPIRHPAAVVPPLDQVAQAVGPLEPSLPIHDPREENRQSRNIKGIGLPLCLPFPETSENRLLTTDTRSSLNPCPLSRISDRQT